MRPKPCRLARHAELRWRVAQKLALQWSPEQISGWLKRQFPADQGVQVSHETIYREIYNPNPWMTFGGMRSRKLVGPNVEYIVNNDTHPGAQFNSEFRNLVKTEIARLSAADDQNTTDELITPETRIPAAQYPAPQPPPVVAYPPPTFDPSPASSPHHLGAYPYSGSGVQPSQDRGTMVAALPPEYQPERGSANIEVTPLRRATIMQRSVAYAFRANATKIPRQFQVRPRQLARRTRRCFQSMQLLECRAPSAILEDRLARKECARQR